MDLGAMLARGCRIISVVQIEDQHNPFDLHNRLSRAPGASTRWGIFYKQKPLGVPVCDAPQEAKSVPDDAGHFSDLINRTAAAVALACH
jgi:hypothetical protein